MDAEELTAAMRELNLDITQEQAQKVLERYDVDNNGSLEIEEFADLHRHFSKFTSFSVKEKGEDSFKHKLLRQDSVPMEVKSLDAFVLQGKTGFSPRVGEEYDPETAATVEFMKSLGVTKFKKEAMQSL